MEKLNLANLPTKIIKLENLSKKYNKNIYLKRDDFTGTETSGNKIRKLEYSLADALNKGCKSIITTGALQSNHCRATVAACSYLGLECYLVLRGENKKIEGNLFLDYILGGKIHIVKDNDEVDKKIDELYEKLDNEGKKPYIIPMGASNAIGTYGYINAYDEIIKQEKELDINFDIISLAVGSGGTYSGLWYGNYAHNNKKQILGFSVSESGDFFKDIIIEILKDLDKEIFKFNDIIINDSYIGEGYGIATREELEFYYNIGKLEGFVLDPCYTGKAFRGLLKEIELGNIEEENILFIHTGGLMGWTEDQRNLIYEIAKENKN